jgi:hypothetical protein
VLSLFLLLYGTASAEVVNDLYSAETPVAGQGAEARAAGQRESFAKVLVKVSGDRGLPDKSAIAKELSKANQYVQQYAYRALDTQTEAEPGQTIEQLDTKQLPDRLLWVQFDETAVNRLLRSKGIPVWGKARPLVLIWLGIDHGGRRSVLQADLETALYAALEQAGDARGQPILFPLMDLEDRANLQVSDIWGGFEEAIRRASDRYLPDVILVGRLRNRGGSGWEADWSLYQPDGVKHWETRGQTQLRAATEGMHQMVDRLAARFAPRTARGDSNLRVRVAGLNHLADYLLVKDYLSSLDTIKSLDLLSAAPSEVSFLVRVQGDRETLARGIMLGRLLEPVSSQDTKVDSGNGPVEELDEQSLDYRLRP